MKEKNIDKLVAEALAIEAQEAKEAGALGFMARALTQATMPHSKPKTSEFVRRNGAFTLTMLAPSRVGLPYGSIPRLLIAWITTEALRTKERTLILGDSLSDFMRQLDMVPTGGRWGSITRLRHQTSCLFKTSISCTYELDGGELDVGFRIADRTELWWQPRHPQQQTLFNSSVTLSQPFFEEIVSRPVPVDMRTLKLLKKSPMALDIYCWITYRNSYLRKPTRIPWEALQAQFGSGYAETSQGKQDFKRKFTAALQKVAVAYDAARSARPESEGLKLVPSKPHIPKLR